MAIRVPMAHMNRDSPTLPDRDKIVLGVAKIPVPMIRLKIRNEALTTPICRRSSGVASKTLPSSKRNPLDPALQRTYQTGKVGESREHTELRDAVRPPGTAFFDGFRVGHDFLGRIHSQTHFSGCRKRKVVVCFRSKVQTFPGPELYKPARTRERGYHEIGQSNG